MLEETGIITKYTVRKEESDSWGWFFYHFAHQVVNITLICSPLVIKAFWDNSNYSFMCIYLEYDQCEFITVKEACKMRWHNSLNSHT